MENSSNTLYSTLRFVCAIYGVAWLYNQLFILAPRLFACVVLYSEDGHPPYGTAYLLAQQAFKGAFILLVLLAMACILPWKRIRPRLNLFWLLLGLFALTLAVLLLNVGVYVHWINSIKRSA